MNDTPKLFLYSMSLTEDHYAQLEKLTGKKAITYSILMRARSRTVRYIQAVHDLETKTIHLRSVQREQKL